MNYLVKCRCTARPVKRQRWVTSAALVVATMGASVWVSNAAGGQWTDLQSMLRGKIKQLGASEEKLCATELDAILNQLQINDCATDAECALVGEMPFGAAIGVRSSVAKDLQSRMSKYHAACDDGSTRSDGSGVEHRAVCSDKRCVVATSLRKYEGSGYFGPLRG